MELTQQEKGKLDEVKDILHRIYTHPDQDFNLVTHQAIVIYAREARDNNPTEFKDVILWHMLSKSTGGSKLDFEGRKWSLYAFMKKMEKRIPS